MSEGKKLIKVPPLRKKGRSLVDVGCHSLAAALNWDTLARELAATAPAELPQVEDAPAPAAPAGEKEQ